MKIKLSLVSNSFGQSILEWVLSLGLITPAIFGAAWLLRAEWLREECAYHVFEKTHARLLGMENLSISGPIVTNETQTSVDGSGTCADRHGAENVSFRKLEAFP